MFLPIDMDVRLGCEEQEASMQGLIDALA